MQKKIQKDIFVSEVNAYELARWIVSIKKIIFAIGNQCVNKQS